MASLRELQNRTEVLLTQPVLRDEGVLAEDPVLAQRVRRPFSVFNTDDLDQALSLADRWMALAVQPGESARARTRGLEAALDDAEVVREVQNPDLVEYALLVFLTHYRDGARLPLPSLLERHPELFGPAEGLIDEAVDPEAALDYWRVDPLANQHHEHWHVVYPSSGVPDGRQGRVVKKRHGELFAYMHRQMLARYDAERRSLGLAPVVAYSNYRQPIAEAFRPPSPEYNARVAGANPFSVDPFVVAGNEAERDRVTAVGASMQLPNGSALNADRYGDVIEASAGWRLPGRFGLHNEGHGMFAELSPGPGRAAMNSPADAIKDPVFFCWHRHIDDLHNAFQEKLPANNFADAPPVQFPINAVSLLFTDQIPGFNPGVDFSSWARARFGGIRWAKNDDPSVTNELQTHMATAPTMGSRPYLDHRDFAYVVRLENTAARKVNVTLRIFLVPDAFAKDHRQWIELDKFPVSLAPRAKTAIPRWGGLSSIVQKPVTRPPSGRRDPNRGGPDGGAWDETNYCTCGWPFHLLLPRGTPTGMPCQLLVMATDADKDQVIQDRHCGSLSFCGAKDVDYPDTREMGYPFDRRFARGAAPATILGTLANVTIRPVTIRHLPAPPG